MTHSPRTSIGCVQHKFCAGGTFDTNRALFLRQDYHYLQTDSNKLPLKTRHLGVSSGASKMISKPMVRSAQTVHLYCTDTNTVSKRTETRFHNTHHLGLPSGACKTISEPTVRLVKTAHLSCVKISTISKQTQTSFNLSLVTLDYHRMRLK
jgi:hypothetical protein